MLLRSCKTARGQVIKSAPVAGYEDVDLICAFDVLTSLPGGLGAETAPNHCLASTAGRLCDPVLTGGLLCASDKAGLLRRLSLFREADCECERGRTGGSVASWP